ncbi:MAG TPA: PIN domain-containing protein, partial [Bacteroidales bacterium]|nr:PIN domain-containing protein [Bacteroidales bacterium]
MKNTTKIFVLDTNVLLHDHECLFKFQENDIIIPIVVLEELDHFKRGNDLINFHAREFTRVLDELSGEELFE